MTEAMDLIDRYYATWNDRNWDDYDSLLTADATEWASGGPSLQGIEEIVAFDKGWADAFPDARITSLLKTSDGNTVISENRFVGAQTGPFHTSEGEVPPTGIQVEIPFVGVFELEGGRVKAERIYYDRLGLLSQLDLL